MLIDRHPYGGVFARVPELAGHTDPVLRPLDRLLDGEVLYMRVRADLIVRGGHLRGRPPVGAGGNSGARMIHSASDRWLG